MKGLTVIFLFVGLFSFGQDSLVIQALEAMNKRSLAIIKLASNGVVYNLNDHSPLYEPSEYSLKLHTSLKPMLNRSAIDSLNPKVFTSTFQPLADFNYFGGNSNASFENGARLGAGVEWNGRLNNKWHFSVRGVQGIYSGDTVYRPKSYLNWRSGSTNLYTDIRSRISYSPNSIFNFQVGVDHNFIGEGSRSLFLSDYGNPYPFAMIRAQFWRVEYAMMYQFLREPQGDRWRNKYVASHHISFNAAKWLNIGVFESVVFAPKDTLLNRGFDVEYLNPVVFFRPQEYALGSSDNVLLGIDLTARVKKLTFYSQFILDEFYLAEIKAHSGWWANKFGGQFGVKSARNLQKGRLFYRTELNFARPYTYAHLNNGLNYGNQGLPLAHPYGSNFTEILAEARYACGRWFYKAFLNYSLRGGDANGYNYGANIYEPYINRPYEFGHFIGQGTQTNAWLLQLGAEYRFLKKLPISAFVENNFRYTVQTGKVNNLIVVGIRTKLWNDYRNY